MSKPFKDMTIEEKKAAFLHFDGRVPPRADLEGLSDAQIKTILADQREKAARYMDATGYPTGLQTQSNRWQEGQSPLMARLHAFAADTTGRYDSLPRARQIGLIRANENTLAAEVLAPPGIAPVRRTAAPAADNPPAAVPPPQTPQDATPAAPAPVAPTASPAPSASAPDDAKAAEVKDLLTGLKKGHEQKTADAPPAAPPVDPAVRAEIRQTQALLHMFGAYPGEGPGSADVDGIKGPRTRAALDAFAAEVRKADPSVPLHTYEDIAAQLRAEALARPGLRATAAGMATSAATLDRDIAREVEGFYAASPVPETRRAVLPDGDVRRTLVGTYTKAAAAPAVAAAAPAPAAESAFEEIAQGHNDASVRLRQQSPASQKAAQTAPAADNPPAAVPSPQTQDLPPIELVSTRREGASVPPPAQTDAPADARGANIMEALGRAPGVKDRAVGQALGQAFIQHLEAGKVRPNEPVLFAGSQTGRYYAAYMNEKGAVYAKDITDFHDPRLRANPVVRDMAALAKEGKGGFVDTQTRIADAERVPSPRRRMWEEGRDEIAVPRPRAGMGSYDRGFVPGGGRGGFSYDDAAERARIPFRGNTISREDRMVERELRAQERQWEREMRAAEREQQRWERRMEREEMRQDRQWQLGVRGSLNGAFRGAMEDMDRDTRRIVGPLVRPLADDLSHTITSLMPRLN